MRAKRALDLVLLALAAPPLLAVAALLGLLVLVVDGRPILFAQPRLGRGGRPFRIWKLRTMTCEADVAARRPTRLGGWLRQRGLDELPQLLNVLRGEMSLVGPRPVLAAELEQHYGPAAAAHYLSVRPGITGPWQISGRNDVDYERRVALDAWYVRNWTLWYDVLILFKTLLIVPSRSSGAY